MRLQHAFAPFLAEFVTYEVLVEKLIPSVERMLLRSPEIALDRECLTGRVTRLTESVATELLTNVPHDISAILPAKLVPSVLSAAKSSSNDTRTKCVSLMKALISRCGDQSVRGKILSEVLALPRTGKTTSAENRATLFNLAALFPPSKEVSGTVTDTLAPLIAKEGSEPTMIALSSALVPHLGFALWSSVKLPASTTSTLSKELQSSKLATRRLTAHAVGEAIWGMYEEGRQFSPEGEGLVTAISAALETCLQTASINNSMNPGGFLEGYIVTALALGPLRHVNAATKLVNSPVLQNLLVVSPKPSFLLNDKAFSKLPAPIDEKWLLRALETVVTSQSEKLNTATLR